MSSVIHTFFSTGSFIPHGHCYLWQPQLVGLHILADTLIAIAYYSIPLALLYVILQRQDLPFRRVFLLFSAFIAACGTTHLLEIWTLWYPFYWLSGAVKLVTAAISIGATLELIPLLPKVLALPSPVLLERANRELEREIGERKQIEAALRVSEARYRAIVEDQTELIARFQPDGTLTFVNEAYCRYFEVSREATIGSQYAPILFEDDRALVDRQVRAMNFENPTATIENRVVINGDIRWTQWNNRMLFDKDNQFVEFQSVGHDITRFKEAKAALQSSQRFIEKVAAASPVFIYVFDLVDERNVYTNRDIMAQLGYAPGEIESTPTAFPPTILHPADLATLPDNFRRWDVAQDGELLSAELRMRHCSGEWRHFHCQETLFARNPNGSPQQILGVAVDITAAKRLEELRRAEERLQASLQEKEVLLKEIHHRVKNNLQIVYSLLRLQYRRIKNQPAATILLESQNRIKSIALVHEKLYRSDDLASIDLSHYIPSLVNSLFSSYAVRPNAIQLKTDIERISLDIDTAIPCGLIINELVSNALKYAFPVEQTGEIAIGLQVADDRTVSLHVRDNGIGIPAALDLTKIDSLGLKLVNDLVHQLEGTITLDRNHGTEFEITFIPGEA